ncbi:hypothetical protein [Brumimicrobium aurantiacum]|nr:hypothetical protein [Brumimicrobium aurantiacum]
MGKQFLFAGLSVCVLLFMIRCSSDTSLENGQKVQKSSIIKLDLKEEVEKLVDLHCKAINVLRKVEEGDRTALNRSNAYRKKADKLAKQLQQKYTSPEEQEQFSTVYQAALVNCPYEQ